MSHRPNGGETYFAGKVGEENDDEEEDEDDEDDDDENNMGKKMSRILCIVYTTHIQPVVRNVVCRLNRIGGTLKAKFTKIHQYS